jgi:hypothetical protein
VILVKKESAAAKLVKQIRTRAINSSSNKVKQTMAINSCNNRVLFKVKN